MLFNIIITLQFHTERSDSLLGEIGYREPMNNELNPAIVDGVVYRLRLLINKRLNNNVVLYFAVCSGHEIYIFYVRCRNY